MVGFLSVFRFSKIAGEGMNPNYKNGQTFLFVNYLFGKVIPLRGTVVLYTEEDQAFPSIGRVVGLPEEEFEIRHGDIYLKLPSENQFGKMYEEYLPPSKQGIILPDTKFRLKDDEHLILRDNRVGETNLDRHKINKSRIKSFFLIKI